MKRRRENEIKEERVKGKEVRKKDQFQQKEKLRIIDLAHKSKASSCYEDGIQKA